MYSLVVKSYLRHFEGDNRYTIENVMCTDEQIGKWLAKPKTWNYELISYRHI